MNQRVDVGEVFSRAFGIYGSQAGTLLPAALVLFLVVGVVQGLLGGILVLLGLLISFLASTIFQGMVVRLVEDVQDGQRDYSVGQLFASVTPVLVSLIIAGFLSAVIVTVGFVIIIIPGIVALTFLSVVGPVVVIERVGPTTAIGRSFALVKGQFFPVLGVIVLSFIIVFVVSLIFGIIGGLAGSAGAIVLRIVASTLTAPFAALVAAVLYFQLRGAEGGTGAVGGYAPAGPEAVGNQPPPPPPPPGAAV